MTRIIVNSVAAALFSGGLLLAGTSAALAAPEGVPLETAPIADSGSTAGALATGILNTGSSAIKCMLGGGDWSSFPRGETGPTGCVPGTRISAETRSTEPIADSGSSGSGSAATGSAQLLLNCLTNGSSVAGGDVMGFPALCR